MYSPCSAGELNSDPVSFLREDRLPLLRLLASARKIGLGFSEWRPSKSFILFIFSRISASTSVFSSAWRSEISLLLIMKSPLSRLIRDTIVDFFRFWTFLTQDWKLIIAFLMLPISTSKKMSSGHERDRLSSCSGSGIAFFNASSSRSLLSNCSSNWMLVPLRAISCSRSFISLNKVKKDPTSSLPLFISKRGLFSGSAWLM